MPHRVEHESGVKTLSELLNSDQNSEFCLSSVNVNFDVPNSQTLVISDLTDFVPDLDTSEKKVVSKIMKTESKSEKESLVMSSSESKANVVEQDFDNVQSEVKTGEILIIVITQLLIQS